jgi:uncharacterized protein YyaL (SSP411 family)
MIDLMTNKLAQESSPYLLQHADNPVDWYPWGPDAFERARAEDKPILLSVGYAACHWCHVMEHESFEDPQTAALMNEHFVCVKVDREERPDVDSLYMNAVQAMTGQGGWPMTVWLTPERVPFYGGTYFPPTDRGGLPGFPKLLVAIAETWRERRGDVETQGQRLVAHIGDMTRFEPSDEDVTEDMLRTANDRLNSSFDPVHGGFGGAPKFPQPMTLDLLLRLEERGYAGAGEMATRTLDAMASGGIFDQLAGGFHRYSVDRAWIVPHFEKMLYDNAQLLRTYARSWVQTGSALHREVAEATAGWMLAEMRDPGGGFWSSLDADSEGHEGLFYVWSLDEVADVLGPEAETAIALYGLTPKGNFEGRNIPVRAREEARADTEPVRAALLAQRAERARPATDTKVLTAWNALAAAGLAEAGTILGHADWVRAAAETMEFVFAELRVDGRLMRSFRRVDGNATVRALGCSDDYANVLQACITLFEATFDMRWLKEARWAADEAIHLFADDADGGFFTTGSDAEGLVVRPKDLFDNAIPSGNSTLALELQRLTHLVGDFSYEQRALQAIKVVRQAAAQAPTGFGTLLAAVDFYTGAAREIVIVGPRGRELDAMLDVVRSRLDPNRVVVVAHEPTDEDAAQIPLLEGRTGSPERPTAYVCRGGVCRMPVTTADDLAEELAGAGGRPAA